MIIKICGLRDLGSAQVAARSGADLLGFIFAPSRRQVDAHTVAGIREGLRISGSAAPMVGIFVNPDPAQLKRDIKVSGIDFVQLSGNEDPDDYADLPVPVVKAIPAGQGDSAAALLAQMKLWDRARYFLIDASVPGAHGGTGQLANWEVAREVAAARPNVLLAGGLSPDNVREAIATVRPAGVDVASGVEIRGRKDPDRIEAFIQAARA